MPSWLEQKYLDNPLWLWSLAVLTTLIGWTVFMLVRRLIVNYLGAWAVRVNSSLVQTIAAILSRTRAVFLLAMAVFLGSLLLELGPRAAIFRRAVVFIVIVQAGFWASALLIRMLTQWRERKTASGSAASAMLAMGFLGQILIWSTVVLLALDNFGVKVTALLAGLGVGGVAIALAVQNILGDLFASISILLDKPFEIGDFIIVGDMMGTVEYIGLKTTRLRSLTGEQIILSNGDLLGSRIRNFKRMYERRVSFLLNVAYGTPVDKLAGIPRMVQDILEGKDKVRFDRAHLQKLGDYAVVYEIVYFVTDPDHTLYMDIQQELNLTLLKRFEEEGIGLAYPTQTVQLHVPPAASQAVPAAFGLKPVA